MTTNPPERITVGVDESGNWYRGQLTIEGHRQVEYTRATEQATPDSPPKRSLGSRAMEEAWGIPPRPDIEGGANPDPAESIPSPDQAPTPDHNPRSWTLEGQGPGNTPMIGGPPLQDGEQVRVVEQPQTEDDAAKPTGGPDERSSDTRDDEGSGDPDRDRPGVHRDGADRQGGSSEVVEQPEAPCPAVMPRYDKPHDTTTSPECTCSEAPAVGEGEK